MNLITVIPITRAKVGAKSAGMLTYFTAADAPVGAIVSVPIRSKSVNAVVVETRPVADLKTEIRSAPFEIKKLQKVRATEFFPASFIHTAKKLADFYATSPGAIIHALVTDVILENTNKIAPLLPLQNTPLKDTHAKTASPDETYAVQGDDADRMSTWRSVIRQQFARKRSLALYTPTIEDACQLFTALEKGIEGYIFLLHGGLASKKTIGVWKAIAATDHPVVIVATGSFSVLPRADIETVVIERENARGWIGQRAPYLDLRRALESLGRAAHRTVYLSDSLLSAETLYRLEEREISEGSPFKWRAVSNARDLLIDMQKSEAEMTELARQLQREKLEALHSASEPVIEISNDSNDSPAINPPAHKNSLELRIADLEKDIRNANKADGSNSILSKNSHASKNGKSDKPKFRVLSETLLGLIQQNKEESTHLFILTSRRGTSPITICDDCETIVTCRKCGTPVVLHTSKETGRTFFMCHRCGERRSADQTCVNCSGWRLTALGIGIDRVREEIAAQFPDAAILKIDADTTKTEIEIAKTLVQFRAKPGSILLGTEMALPYIALKIDHIAIASLDSLFALPDFRIEERIMYALIRLRGLATRSFLVQTRRASEHVFEFGLKGNLSDFNRATLDARRRFNYPPFSTLIKISLEGKKETIASHMGELQALIAPHDIAVFPAFTASVRGNSVIHGLITLDPHQWPEPELLAKLRSLPPNVSVKVNPESLL